MAEGVVAGAGEIEAETTVTGGHEDGAVGGLGEVREARGRGSPEDGDSLLLPVPALEGEAL